MAENKNWSQPRPYSHINPDVINQHRYTSPSSTQGWSMTSMSQVNMNNDTNSTHSNSNIQFTYPPPPPQQPQQQQQQIYTQAYQQQMYQQQFHQQQQLQYMQYYYTPILPPPPPPPPNTYDLKLDKDLITSDTSDTSSSDSDSSISEISDEHCEQSKLTPITKDKSIDKNHSVTVLQNLPSDDDAIFTTISPSSADMNPLESVNINVHKNDNIHQAYNSNDTVIYKEIENESENENENDNSYDSDYSESNSNNSNNCPWEDSEIFKIDSVVEESYTKSETKQIEMEKKKDKQVVQYDKYIQEQEIRQYEEYIKKHNKRKKKKKKNKKNKKTNNKTPIVITESETYDLWDLYDMYEHHLKEQQMKAREKQKLYELHEKEKEKLEKKKKKKKLNYKNKKLSPKYRKQLKEERERDNLSANGNKIKVNHRYRTNKNVIGICKFRGRTNFGKPYEDWVGLLVEYGKGNTNGTIDGIKYFSCKQGRGIMVRPQDIIQEFGLANGTKINTRIINDVKKVKHLLQNHKKSIYY